MLEVNFDGHYTTRWTRVKEYFPVREDNPWEAIKGKTRYFIKNLIEEITEAEFTESIKADYYAVTPERLDYRNGKRKRSLKTSFGTIKDIRVPRGRKSGYRFSLIKRYRRMHKEVDTAVLWATLCGMSDRRTTEFFSGFLGTNFSESTVSNILKRLDEELKTFRNFPIALRYPYLIVDGLSIHIIEAGMLTEKVVIFAMGIDSSGKADILAFMLANAEDEESCKKVLNDLYRRGLDTVDLIIHDGAPGIKAACSWVYPYAEQQRCLFHKQMNLIQNIKHIKNKKPMLKESKKIFKSKSKKEALTLASKFRQNWYKKEPKAINRFFKDFDSCLTYFNFTTKHWRYIKTTNYLELYFKHIRSRIRRIGCFRNRPSAERYLFGLTKLIYHKLENISLKDTLHTFS